MKKQFIHALKSFSNKKKKYFYISLTLIVCLISELMILTINESNFFNQNKHELKMPDNYAYLQINNTEKKFEVLKRDFLEKINKKKIRYTEYTTAPSFDKKKEFKTLKEIDVRSSFFYIDKLFFNFPYTINDKLDFSHIIFGRNFSQKEINNKEKVVIIDEVTSLQLFGKVNSYNEVLTIKNGSGNVYSYRVIGVVSSHIDAQNLYKKKKYNLTYFLPFTLNTNIYSRELAFAMEPVDQEELINFSRTTSSGMTASFFINSRFKEHKKESIILGSIIISVISFVLGITFYSILANLISDRKHEIGVKKALGASNLQITFQFLIEALLVFLISTILAILLAVFLLYGWKLYNEFINKSEYILYISSYLLMQFLAVNFFQIIVYSISLAHNASKVEIIKNLRGE